MRVRTDIKSKSIQFITVDIEDRQVLSPRLLKISLQVVSRNPYNVNDICQFLIKQMISSNNPDKFASHITLQPTPTISSIINQYI